MLSRSTNVHLSWRLSKLTQLSCHPPPLDPKGKRLDSRRIIGPLTGEVELNVFFKLGRKSLEPEAFIKSSLFAEIINSLNTLATDEAVSIQRVGETKVVSDSPKAHACATPCGETIDFDSLIHVQPCVLPLKSSLQQFMKRFNSSYCSSLDIEAVPSDHEAASDHGDVWMDEEEDQNIMADKENNSDVSLYLTGGSDNDIAMSSS
ncbi:hypothetical protein PGT21_022405 [Puccinia graminis f. sp. tritici]|uniref:Uncharacterized protein n=1 Tax=Puccinia graminis f. sp. tritici TaxID=56615 RepID=A0A5B0NAX7_PUCGR|nr:hypothetical protein PGT21_022405 [Puccinia graminis f. sp. tritici]